MKKYIIIIALLIISLPCFAVNWEECGYKTYIDLSTWRKEGNHISAWIKTLNPGDWKLIDNKKVWFSIEYATAYCDSRMISIKNLIYYDLQGNVIRSYNELPTLMHVVPGSVGESNYYAMCSLR